MIIPVAHEHMEHRRWPVITIGIVAICFITHAIVTPIEKQRTTFANQAVNAAFVYHAEHPYLKSPPPLENLLGYSRASRPRVAKVHQKPSDDAELLQQQLHFDRLVQTWQQHLDELPHRKYGFIPARISPTTIISHQFIHNDWIHLLSNLWFLWLCGVNLEDRWGRLLYAPFYLACGIAAAFTEYIFGNTPNIPRIGASGAIAGAMGAFLVIFTHTRIRFLTFVRFHPFFFTARAYVMLPLWFASQVFYFLFAKPGNVAYGAHVGGFVFGLCCALVLKFTGIDGKLDHTINEKITVRQDPRIVQASDLTTEGHGNEALSLLDQVPDGATNIDVQLETLRAAKASKNLDREMDAYGRLMQLHVRDNQIEPAIHLFREVRTDKHLPKLPAPVLMTMGQTLASSGFERDATDAYEAVHQGNPANLVAVKAAIAQAKIESRLGASDHARSLLTMARQSPFSTKELDDVVDEEMKKLA